MIAEGRGGRPLDEQFDSIRSRLAVADPVLGPEALTFKLSDAAKARAAPTVPQHDDVRRGRLLVGEVHDCYAAALGGVAGHAGLFGTAAGVAAFARIVLRAARKASLPAPMSASCVARFTRRSAVAGSSRALGWDTMLPTSSCGTRMSPAAVGHVGFTGTSLWIDPIRDRYFVLLTNRACDGGTLEQMRAVRRSFHDELTNL
jgi:CubicO group peptidase (beta-lactamase class C family)